MSIKEFKAWSQAQPFVPFTIHLADGREILVPHPDYVFVPPIGHDVIVVHPEGGMNFIDVSLVTDLERKPRIKLPKASKDA